MHKKSDEEIRRLLSKIPVDSVFVIHFYEISEEMKDYPRHLSPITVFDNAIFVLCALLKLEEEAVRVWVDHVLDEDVINGECVTYVAKEEREITVPLSNVRDVWHTPYREDHEDG